VEVFRQVLDSVPVVDLDPRRAGTKTLRDIKGFAVVAVPSTFGAVGHNQLGSQRVVNVANTLHVPGKAVEFVPAIRSIPDFVAYSVRHGGLDPVGRSPEHNIAPGPRFGTTAGAMWRE
jgi:hypothetical protein